MNDVYVYTVEIKSKDAQMGIGCGYVLPENQISNLVGKLLTLVETLGLQEKQEKSFKSIIKQAVWDNVTDGKRIDGNLLTLVNNFSYEKDREEKYRNSNVDNVQTFSPQMHIVGDYELSFKETKDTQKVE